MFSRSTQTALASCAVLMASSSSLGVVEIINESGPPLTPPIGDQRLSFWFGIDVATGGGRTFVGAPTLQDPIGRVFVFDSATGALGATLVAPDGAAQTHNFGRLVAADGDTVVVGAIGENPQQTGQVFVHDAITGAFLFELSQFGMESGTLTFGSSIAIGSGVIAVGQPWYGSASASGAVFLYDAETGAPIDAIYGTDEPGVLLEAFGTSVAISNGILAIGRPNYGGQAGGPQDVSLYDLETLTLIDVVEAPPGTSDRDRFGQEIAMNHDTLVVCAPQDDPYGPGSGSAYAYDISPNACTLRTSLNLVHQTGANGSEAGRMSAAISDSGLIVISSVDNGDAEPSIRLFDGETGAFVGLLENTSMTPHHSYYGRGLAFDGDEVIVGSPSLYTSEPDSVFRFSPGVTITQQPTSFVTSDDQVTHVFSVSATAAASYQWYKDGAPVVDGPHHLGATSNSLHVANASLTEGAYACEITSNTTVATMSETAYLVFQGGAPSSCPADVTTTGAGRDSGSGVPDGYIDLSDLLYFVTEWSNTQGACP